MAFTEEDKQKMDNAAADAQNALMELELDGKTMSTLGGWMREWTPRAGYKRLGHILLEFADKRSK